MSGAVEGVDLLPCPFCGGEACRFTIGDDEPNNAGGDVIVCTACQASSHVEFGRKENLVSRWNTRTTPPARSYADGVEDAAARCDSAAKQAEEVADQCSTGQGAHNLRVRASAARCLAAAIRLLSQGEKA